MVEAYLLILVAHTVRLEDDRIEVVRIVSARRLVRAERKRYEQGEIQTRRVATFG